VLAAKLRARTDATPRIFLIRIREASWLIAMILFLERREMWGVHPVEVD